MPDVLTWPILGTLGWPISLVKHLCFARPELHSVAYHGVFVVCVGPCWSIHVHPSTEAGLNSC